MERDHSNTTAGFQNIECIIHKSFDDLELVIHGDPECLKRSRCRVDLVAGLAADRFLDQRCKVTSGLDRVALISSFNYPSGDSSGGSFFSEFIENVRDLFL